MGITFSRTTGVVGVLAALGATFVAVACTGGDGATGETGVAGPPGPPGGTGAPGPLGSATDGGANVLSGACTQPCHTFGGVVDQWRFSNHSHPQENLIGGGPCGNCHGVDGLQQRVAGKYVVIADAGAPVGVPSGHMSYTTGSGAVTEIGYGGASTIGRIHCTTCHDFNPTNDPHVTGKYAAGTARIRVPGGVDDTVLIEKSPSSSATTGQSLAYKAANVCVFCHKSRKDVTTYIGAANVISSKYWGPHEGPQTDVYSGKGGYHFAGLTYGSSAHATLANACVSCHMGPVAANGNVPDHTMKPNVAFCKTCHTQYTGTNFDIQGGRTLVKNALSELEVALNAAGLLTRGAAAPYGPLSADDLADGQFNLDLTRPGSNAGANLSLDALTAGALYNYLIIARSKDLGVHNPTYEKQLLWDSIRQIKTVDPTSLPSRPQ
jgi:hypothetical protein